MLRRLDTELVRRGLARSRESARELIEAGEVLISGIPCQKVTRQVSDTDAIALKSPEERWVSRGAHKLIGALDAFAAQGLSVSGRVALDAGASTGGFTQVLLRRGVERVFAVDVGYGQIAWELRSDERVEVIERVNVRHLRPEQLAAVPDLAVADLSFISLKTVLPAIINATAPAADLVLMVKPQFEVGRELVGDGVVRSPELRAQAVRGVVDFAQANGVGLRGVCASPLPGPEGNVEYFVWLVKGGSPLPDADVENAVVAAIEGGPTG